MVKFKVDLVKLINWNPPACLIARPIVLGTDQTAATNPTTFDGKLFFHFLVYQLVWQQQSSMQLE